MFCSKCGAQNADDDRFCSQCNNPLQNASAAPSAPTTPSAAVVRPVSAPTSVVFQLPAGNALAPALMFWTGHLLALLGWVFAIIFWVKSGKPMMEDSMFGGAIGNPFKDLMISFGFLSFITGHVLQVVFFWASELLKAVRAK